MRIEILEHAAAVAARAADRIEGAAMEAIAARGRFAVALSGGRTPAAALADLAVRDLAWERVHVFQVDERVAPDGHADRNAGALRDLAERAGLPAGNLHLMPVADLDPEAAARTYERTLQDTCGVPPVLDLVQLGLGDDGHTASLAPADPVLEVRDRDVAATGVFRGRRRVTLTFPAIDRAREILWIVTGAAKAAAVRRLVAGDLSIPAGRVRTGDATLLLDAAAGREIAGLATGSRGKPGRSPAPRVVRSRGTPDA